MDRVVAWDSAQVIRWLEKDLGLPVPEEFRESGIDGSRLLTLDEAGLSRLLGVDEDTLYQRLSSHIAELSSAPPAAPVPAPASPPAAAAPAARSPARSPPAGAPVSQPPVPADPPRLPIREVEPSSNAKSPVKARSPGPSRVPRLSLRGAGASATGFPGSSASTSCISSPRHSPSSSSPRAQLFAQAFSPTRATSPSSSAKASSAKTAWSSFGASSVSNHATFFDTSPRRCLSPMKEHIGPGPAGESLSPKKASASQGAFFSEEKRSTAWLYTRSQASPGPKYGRAAASSGKARTFDKTPRAGCSSVKVDLPPRFAHDMPGPGAYHPQFQNSSTFK